MSTRTLRHYDKIGLLPAAHTPAGYRLYGEAALARQIAPLTLKRERPDRPIAVARTLQETEGRPVDFSAFDAQKQEEYAAQAKARWQHTSAYREYEEKSRGRDGAQEQEIAAGLMAIFADIGKLRAEDPASPAAQAAVGRLQAYITAHYYTCTPEILRSLGQMYAVGGAFTENIDKAGGEGTALFTQRAIARYAG